MQSVIALGFFDGVHLGHGELLRRTAALAAETGLRSVALTFDRSPGKDGRLLSTVEDRVRLIRDLYGVEEVLVLPFTQDFMRLSWDGFLETLAEKLEAAHLVCGWDYRFGHLGAGNANRLRDWCAARGLGWDVIPPRVIDGITVSSTYLKTLLDAGDLETAARFYGHPHTLTDTVRTGRGLGHTLGFPTANLVPPPELVLPRDGVYAVRGLIPTEQGLRRCSGVCNVGTRPTVAGHRRTVETWLEDFQGDLYGAELTLEFHRFLRPERKFPDLEALGRQVRQDQREAAAYFDTAAQSVNK